MVPLWSLGTLWLAYFATRAVASDDAPLKCEDLRIGQYICEDPKIDNATQEPMKCTNHTAYVACLPAPNITCKDFSGNETQFTGKEIGFYQPIECRSVNGYSYKVAVALSLFLGWLGADRFYLGYPALGLLKFCTVGFCGIGSLIDFILISMQIVGPSDGSNYIIDYYGARLTRSSLILFECEKMPAYEMMEEDRLQRIEKFHQLLSSALCAQRKNSRLYYTALC